MLTLIKRAAKSFNVLTLLWRAKRTSSVIGFAAGYFLRCLHVRQPGKVFKMLRVGQSVYVDVESIQIEKNELSCGMFF